MSETSIPGKEGFGVERPPFPLMLHAGKGRFETKNSICTDMRRQGNGGFLTQSALFQGEGKCGFFDLETLFSRNGGRLIFVHLQCWEVYNICRFQRQRCIKVRVLRAQDFYTPLALKTAKGQHLQALQMVGGLAR